MTDKIRFTIDGRPAEAEKGSFLLSAIESLGIDIPTLCHHPSLEPSGACRLCVVEITHPNWKGWSGLVTSCLYPAEAGLVVSTRSEKVVHARKTLLELYLARYPAAEEIRTLARNEGVDVTSYPDSKEGDTCVICGLCTRVCQDLGPRALAPLSRGTEKAVGPRPDNVGEDCTACGACAFICPTKAIEMKQEGGKHLIWNRTFDIEACKVKPETCRGCGVCEEVCPWAIPRVTAFRTGSLVAQISETACTGCGLCAGACPTGAIQQGFDLPDVTGRTVVFACSRSPMPEETKGVVRVPCIGRVPVETLLECLARGATGVMMMCRDQATCPSGRGGAQGEKRVHVAAELAESAGLGRGRVQFLKPAPGWMGPGDAYKAFAQWLDPLPYVELYEKPELTGMDLALDIMHWFRSRPELTPVPLEGGDSEADNVLYLGDLFDLDLLLSLIVHEWRLKEVLEDAARLLAEKGIAFRPALSVQQVKESKASRVITLCACGNEDFGVEQVTLNELVGMDPPADHTRERFRFQITQKERQSLAEALRNETICSCPYELAQYKLVSREGAWQEGIYTNPVMGFSDAVRETES